MSRGDRKRLDQVLVDRRLAASRNRARALIMAGKVRVNDVVASKPAALVGEGDRVEVETPPRFVSRGGDKLDAAIAGSDIDVRDRVCIDIGASTGGFTDCLLRRGAARVIAVDVGYGQLDFRLRSDARVTVLERVNARYLRREDLPAGQPEPDLLVMDVAFISVTKVLPAVSALCAPASDALVLVKPQFECGPQQVGSGGIVASAALRRTTVEAAGGAAEKLGWQVAGAIPSPIRGQAGNWECFLYLRRPPRRGEFASLQEVLDRIEIPEG
jgi:23S rRNA (cytidine1920-2'-O)/16S rRNA (cytidine1409-2'-O)-methyltransferase